MQLYHSQPEQEKDGQVDLHAYLFGGKGESKARVHLFSAQQRLDPSLPLKRNATAAGFGGNALNDPFFGRK